MTGDGDAGVVDPSAQARDGGLDDVELVEDASEVSDPLGPDARVAGVVESDPVAPGVQVGGLDHDEAPGGPERGQRRIAVVVPPVAVREQHDRQVEAGGRRGNPHVERQRTTMGGQFDGGNGHDRSAVTDEIVEGGHKWSSQDGRGHGGVLSMVDSLQES